MSSCEHDNELLVSIKSTELFNYEGESVSR
jgi:hypothetical protein